MNNTPEARRRLSKINKAAEAAIYKRDRHFHLSVLEQTVRCLVRTLGLEQTREILQHYVKKTEEY